MRWPEKPWHYDMMTDTMYVRPWFAALGAVSIISLMALMFRA